MKKPLPKTGGLVPLPDAPFVNDAGVIRNLIHGGFTGTVSVLGCLPHSTRSRHAHKTDSHFLFVAEGKMQYFERAIGSKEDVKPLTVEAGQMVWTPPMRLHKCYFPVRTILVSISAKSRTHEEHEADVIREEWP